MPSQRSPVWLILCSTILLGGLLRFSLPLSAAPPENPPSTPVRIRSGPGTPTRTPAPAVADTSASNVLFINEFLPHPASDWNGDGAVDLGDEFIEVFNSGDAAVDLGGWKLDDVSGGGSSPYAIPAGASLGPHGLLVLFHSETKISLNDTGDDVQLLQPDGTAADVISYSSSRVDHSFSRFPDGAAYFADDCPPTPGASNCSVPATATPIPTPFPGGILVNEFMPQPNKDWNHDGENDSLDEWVELANLSGDSVDLGGWKLDDGEGGSFPFSIPEGTKLDSHAFLLFYADETRIGLNNGGDTVRLLFPDGAVADEKKYASSAPDRAYGRQPDGGARWQTGCYPTPGKANCSVVLTPTPTVAFHLTQLAEARTLLAGSRVTVQGSVIARPCQLDRYGHEMMLSDGANGVDVYLPYPEQLTCAIAMGEQVLVTGVISDHYGLREIRLERSDDLVRNYATPREIPPRSIHTHKLSDAHESVLVSLQGRVVNGTGDAIWLDDGEGAAKIEATQSSGASFAGITRGSLVRVTGVGYHFNRDSAPNEGYTIRPRMPEDVTVLQLADKPPPAPQGRGQDLGAVSIATTHATRTGNYVTVGGIVTVPPGIIGSRDLWLQDASGGVHIYIATSAGEVPSLHLWDNVTVRGRVVSYFGEREVRVEEPSSVQAFGAGAPLTPNAVGTGAVTLVYEGSLVETVGKVTLRRGRELYLNDGSGEVMIYLNPGTRIEIPRIADGDTLRVSGVVRRYSGRAELVPRYPADLRVEGARGSTWITKSAKGITKTAKASATVTSFTSTLSATPTPTLTKRPRATVTATPQRAALAATQVRKPIVLTEAKGISIAGDWMLPAAGVALLLLLGACGAVFFGGLWACWGRQKR